MAVDMLDHLLAWRVTAASEQDRSQVGAWAAKVQEVTGDAVNLTCVDQGDTGAQATQAAEAQHRSLEVIKLPEAKKGFVLLPQRWGIKRSNAWVARFAAWHGIMHSWLRHWPACILWPLPF
jgi:hypothetical protein